MPPPTWTKETLREKEHQQVLSWGKSTKWMIPVHCQTFPFQAEGCIAALVGVPSHCSAPRDPMQEHSRDLWSMGNSRQIPKVFRTC